ncbi:unnamed protein product, partial [Meganyctiphanes norvegica]
VMVVSTQSEVVVAVGACTAVALIWWTMYKRKNRQQQPQFQMPTEWEELGTVSQLHIYPLKSARSIPVSQADTTIRGLSSGSLEDRSFMVVTEAECRFVTMRSEPKLAT